MSAPSAKRPPARKGTRGKGRRGKGQRRGRSRLRRWLLWGAFGSVAALGLLIAGLYVFSSIPEPADVASAQSVVVTDRRGREVGRFHAGADRVSVSLDKVPDHLERAVVAIEDRTFYSHPGVSVGAVVRATLANIVGRGARQGGSTLTQQYVKNAFVGNEKTFMRKAREAALALKLERQRSKDEILELYLNTIYWGRGAYGVEAAAKSWFGKSAEDLSLPEAAMLAGIIHAPSTYDPVHEPERVRARRSVVLEAMRRDGHLTAGQVEVAARAGLNVRRRAAGGLAPHYLEETQRFLEATIGPARLYAGGVTVTGTIDAAMQRAAEDAVAAVYDRPDDPEVALVAIEPATGAVRAMVGARDYARRELNLAMRMRQPGSTFKPMVLSAAVEQGIPVTTRFRAPGSTVFATDSGPWPVSNYDKRSRGTIDLERATELSVNTVYARLILDIGADTVAAHARALGIGSPVDPVPALSLGTEEVTPYELASAYATWAARGKRSDPYLVERVRDREGGDLYRAEPRAERAVEPEVADTVNHVLQQVLRDGTGTGARLGRPAAGKTGTTENLRDAWFAGYTPDLAAVVWNGFAEGGKTLRGVRGRNVTGGSFPARIWRAFMREALAKVKPSSFVKPPAEPASDPSASPTSSATSTGSPSPAPSTPPPSPSPSSSPSPSPSASTPPPSPSPTPTKSGSPSP